MNTNAKKEAARLLGEMTLDEKISLLGGIKGFNTRAIPRLGIKELFMADASHGINLRDEWVGEKLERPMEKSTSFPCLLSLTSTWNTQLVQKYARAVGEEARAAGVHYLLGPGMNLYRHSQCGRNFEYMGEDPYLIARTAENYVEALQETGTAATIKHFTANNTDYFRRKSNSQVDERTLHEIYFPGFKAGIKAGAKAVMTSYNLLNGEWCSQDEVTIKKHLRKELGFDGLVMTDWWAVNDAKKVLTSGQNLEMPKADHANQARELLEKGEISERDIDTMVYFQIKTALEMDFYREDYIQPEMIKLFDQHQETALEVNQEGIVMLTNKGVLPLDKETPILLTGKYAIENAIGGGAAQCEGYNNRTLLQGLKSEFSGPIEYKEKPNEADITQAPLVILSVGTFDSEASDRAFDLPKEEEEYILWVLEHNPNTVIIVNSGSGINMTSWAEKAAAILYCWYGGQTIGDAIPQVLSGKVNPSGKLPITIEKDFAHSPGAGYIPEGEELYSGWKGEEENQREVYNLPYSEGIFVGYRWYDHKGIEPLFPFGHGLSYSTFNYSDLKVMPVAEDKALVICKVTNNSSIPGKEVVQLYLRDTESSHPRPEKELKGFEKVFIAPGETAEVQFILEGEDFSYWNPDTKEWTLEPGEFEIFMGASSRDIKLKGELIISLTAGEI